MPIDKITFDKGLDMDTAEGFMEPGRYPHALNVRPGDTQAGQEKEITPIEGNRQISFTLPAGANTTVRGFEDKENRRLIWWVHNSNNNHSIVIHDQVAKTTQSLFINLTQSNSVDIMPTTAATRIRDAAVINDTLYWLHDGVPFCLQIDRMLSGDIVLPLRESDLRVTKRPPLEPPKNVKTVHDPSFNGNNIDRGKVFYFRIRYNYKDRKPSVYGPISEAATAGGNHFFELRGRMDPWRNNAIEFTWRLEDDETKSVDILVREGDNGSWKLAETIDIEGRHRQRHVFAVELPPIDAKFTGSESDEARNYSFTINSTLITTGSVVVHGTLPGKIVNDLVNLVNASAVNTIVRAITSAIDTDKYAFFTIESINYGQVYAVTSVSDTLLEQRIESVPLLVAPSAFQDIKYLFRNDRDYEVLDNASVNIPFDHVPLTARSQAIINKNVLSYGGITEGRPPVLMDAGVEVEYIEPRGALDTNGDDIVGTELSPSSVEITIDASVPFSPGDFVYVQVYENPSGHVPPPEISNEAPEMVLYYEVKAGDTSNEVLDGLAASLERRYINGITVQNNHQTGFGITKIIITSTTWSSGKPRVVKGFIVKSYPYDKVLSHGGTYNYAAQYSDGYGRFSPANFIGEVTIPDVGQAGFNFKAPRAKITIRNRPPEWATKYSILRTPNIKHKIVLVWQQFQSVRVEVSLIEFKLQHGSLKSYQFVPGDKMIFSQGDDSAYPSPIGGIGDGYFDFYKEFEVLSYDTATDVISIDGTEITQIFPITFNGGEVFKIIRPVTSQQNLFFEIAHHGDILESGANRAHEGINSGDQDQDLADPSGIPAILHIQEGDMWFRAHRELHKFGTPEVIQSSLANLHIFDTTFSDFAEDATNVGRPNAENINAIEETKKATIRWSLPEIEGTVINGLSTFLSENQRTYDDVYGFINKMRYKNRRLLTIQETKAWQVLVNQEVLFGASGDQQVRKATEVLGDSIPYEGEYGISDASESYAECGHVDMFVDSRNGTVMRIAQDGLIPVSKTAEMDHLFSRILPLTTGRIRGAYHEAQGEYVMSIERTDVVVLDIPVGQFTSDSAGGVTWKRDSGWTYVSGKATYAGGTIASRIRTLHLLNPYRRYKITYTIVKPSGGISAATFQWKCGDNKGVLRTATNSPVTYTEEILCLGSPHLTGIGAGLLTTGLSLDDVSVEEIIDDTIAFSIKRGLFTSPYDYVPEELTGFGTSMVAFKAGLPWVHDAVKNRCNFFGTQKKAQVMAISGATPGQDKIFDSVSIISDQKWFIPHISTPVNEQYPLGQFSRLKKDNVKRFTNGYYADFLMDINDGRFVNLNELEGLFKGRKLRNFVIRLLLEATTPNNNALTMVNVSFNDSTKNL